MHIFITGIAGLIGSHLADFYIKKNFKVSGCDNLVGGDLDNVNKKVNFFKIDFLNLNELVNITKNVDVIVHAGAIATEGLSVFSPSLIAHSNFTGSTAVFTAAVINKIRRVVYCSSMARYGRIKTPYTEDQIPEPIDPYGISKLAAEKILINMSVTHGFEYNIAIPHNVIGPNQKYNDPYRNVASIMINLILQKKKPIIYGDGSQKRSFSDIDDCIYCLNQLITNPNIISETVNIGPDEEFISIKELCDILSNKLKSNLDPQYFPMRPQEISEAFCSSNKARKLLNYRTTVSLSSSLDKIIDKIKKKGTKPFEYIYNLEINNELTPKTWKQKIF
jgi:UDP-glucose 4-epimerase